MNELHQTRLFDLLIEPAQESTKKEMQEAYEDFVTRTKHLNQYGEDYSEVFRILSTTRIELAFTESLHSYGQEKKCTENIISSKNA